MTEGKPDWIDDYGCVLNRLDAYKTIAISVRGIGPTCVAWTDERGTQYDMVLARSVAHIGMAQGGMHRAGLIYVGIMRLGCWGFDPAYQQFPDYLVEKLNVSPGVTAEALATFLNGVFTAFRELSKDNSHG
jgi:hypothetical protein